MIPGQIANLYKDLLAFNIACPEIPAWQSAPLR